MPKTCAPKVLTIDIGNSTVGLMLASGPIPHIVYKEDSVPLDAVSNTDRLNRYFKRFLRGIDAPLQVAVSSVVPDINSTVRAALCDFCKRPFFLNSRNSGLSFKTAIPARVGPDRMATTIAAYALAGGPAAVADFGTATTISIIGPERIFLGGAIMPGLNTMKESLYSATAKLPSIKIKQQQRALGDSTEKAILSGIIYGTAGAVTNIIENIESESGLGLAVVLTGGMAEIVAPHLKRPYIIEPGLIHSGLLLALNRGD